MENDSHDIQSAAADGLAGAAKKTNASRPPDVPEKFWNADRGEVRVDALLKSYDALERKLGAGSGAGVPNGPQDYRITLADEGLAIDEQINSRLHALGFNNDQAQLVYDLAVEHLRPLMEDFAGEFEARKQHRDMEAHFGGPEQWADMRRRLKAWSKDNVSEHVREALESTGDGIKALHRMMGEGEPGLLNNAAPGGSDLSEEGLRKMMRDPRYWRDHDPALVRKVTQGFHRLYPS